MSNPRSLTDRELLDLVNETRRVLSQGADRLNTLTEELKRRVRELDSEVDDDSD